MADLSLKGRIFNIQRFSIHDGPGIRTIVFLKGCPLRCRWCCNPEGQEYKTVSITEKDGRQKIFGSDVCVEEVLNIVRRDAVYYRRSGGGITLSGGEMLSQAEFSAEILKACKETGINTAVETTAFAPYEKIENLLPFTDTFMMDIKHMDSAKHKEFTSQPNELILQNAARLAKEAKNYIVRVPVIPGFNDTEREIGDISAFASKIGAQKLHLLPYHRLGADKYKGLGRQYLMEDAPLLEKSKVECLKKTVEFYGLDCTIGG